MKNGRRKTDDGLERRFVPLCAEREMRVVPEETTEDGAEPRSRIEHWAPPWETLSVVLWHEYLGDSKVPVREKFRRGAFADLLNGANVVCLYNHDCDHVLGRTTSGTLALEEDDVGLRYSSLPPETGIGLDVLKLIGRRDITGSSFYFRAAEDDWEDTVIDGKRVLLRTVIKVDWLRDVGPVTFPAYPDGPQGEAGLRSLGLCDEAVRSYERWKSAQSTPVVDPRAAQRAAAVRRQMLAELG